MLLRQTKQNPKVLFDIGCTVVHTNSSVLKVTQKENVQSSQTQSCLSYWYVLYVPQTFKVPCSRSYVPL